MFFPLKQGLKKEKEKLINFSFKIFSKIRNCIASLVCKYKNLFNTSWEKSLYTPTQIKKIAGVYFVADCWHNRIIYTRNLSDPVKKWKNLAHWYRGGHTIACNKAGSLLICDNTDMDELLVFDSKLNLIQKINVKEFLPTHFQYRNEFNLVRPHFIYFDDDEDIFIVALLWANAIMILHDEENHIVVDEVVFPQINSNSYLKFLSKFDGLIWIAESEFWVGFELHGRKLIENKRIRIPEILKNQNYAVRIKNTVYITCWGTGNIFYGKSLDDISARNFSSANDKFNLKGTPYFITNFDGCYWITEIVEHQGIYRFDVDENRLCVRIDSFKEFSEPTDFDIERRKINPVLR